MKEEFEEDLFGFPTCEQKADPEPDGIVGIAGGLLAVVCCFFILLFILYVVGEVVNVNGR